MGDITKQVVCFNEQQATERAIELSKSEGYAAIVLSAGIYYVETSVPLVRVFETLVAQYENGVKEGSTKKQQ